MVPIQGSPRTGKASHNDSAWSGECRKVNPLTDRCLLSFERQRTIRLHLLFQDKGAWRQEPRLDQVPATILSQLIRHYPSINVNIKAAVRKDPDAFYNSLDYQLEDIVIPSLKKAVKTRDNNLIILMDDLDHITSDDHRLQIFGFIKQLTYLKRVVAIFTLREAPSPQDVAEGSTSLAALWRLSENLALGDAILDRTVPSHHTVEDVSLKSLK